jgi:hypothetical protein
MFHQPNIRSWDVEKIMINGKLRRLSLLQMWVETVTTEIGRLVNWPIITLKHDHVGGTLLHFFQAVSVVQSLSSIAMRITLTCANYLENSDCGDIQSSNAARCM